MKKLVLVFFFLWFVLTIIIPVQANNLVEDDADPIRLAKDVFATLLLSGINATAIISQPQGNSKQILINNYYQVPDYARDVWVDDFNFDGFQDIAITSHIDKKTNEPSYVLFTWEQSLNHLIPILFDGPIYNFEYLFKDRLIRSSYQYQQFWTEDSYRFLRKQPYLYLRARLISSNMWYTEKYNSNGGVIKKGVTIDGHLKDSRAVVKRSIISTIANIYHQPSPNASILYTLTRGDEVSLLAFEQGVNGFSWIQVESMGEGKAAKGWLLISNLIDGRD